MSTSPHSSTPRRSASSAPLDSPAELCGQRQRQSVSSAQPVLVHAPKCGPGTIEDCRRAAMSELHGRRALVTGGTRGIGAAIARHLNMAGARVVVAARSRGDYDGPGHFIAADVSTADGPRHLAADAAAHLGGIDILIDNAGSQTLVPAGALAMTDADWLADLNACLLSAVRLDREVLPGMIAD